MRADIRDSLKIVGNESEPFMTEPRPNAAEALPPRADDQARALVRRLRHAGTHATLAVLEPGSGRGQQAREVFLANHPRALLYADFGDFSLWRLEPERAGLNPVPGVSSSRVP